MMDALKRLLADREECCVFYKLIVGEEEPSILEQLEPPPETACPAPEGLNESQILAMRSWRTPLSLIWGPPGMTISRRLISFFS
jgi:regulator of nonsense transcripts 1